MGQQLYCNDTVQPETGNERKRNHYLEAECCRETIT